ncbi:ribosomal protein L11 methyltransferase [Maridesulfovibrio ferrireducens]|uniref:Ribosomal protein L11 methyltransferase n=1 Tax=Maridesulfovibrio ferrireducens TaxID=246191 RepID=A0A1G9KHC2_9BACT|nr:methyltransferase domain-containing protein [Maridesulfovibrio ferrireducens]SDL49300.1 ribosomal protein L11 methyltransferase [Maridesulfovibrio ferrireducens]
MTPNAEIKKIVEEVGQDIIWRPLYDFERNKLSGGVGHDIDGIDPEFTELDFTGKTVCDLGCNLGHFTFYAHERGAKEVVGYDMEPKVIKGAKKLAALYNIEGVEFETCNFASEPATRTFDMGMLIDILGKINISNGFLIPILKGLESRSKSEMLLTFRPLYLVKRHFGMSEDEFLKLYPQAQIKNGFFSLLDFAQNFFAKKWKVTYLSKELPDDEQYKRTVHFIRKA